MNHCVVTSSSLGKLQALCQINRHEELPKQPFVQSHFKGTILEQKLLEAFPLTYQLLKKSGWEELIHAFLASYSHSPYFWLLPKGLSLFVSENGWNEKTKIPYLSELIDLEWLEIEVYMLPALQCEGYCAHGDLMQDVLFVNPDYRMRRYTYPVFSSDKGAAPGRYDLFCFRSVKTKEVRFISLSPFYYQVMELITSQDCTGKDAIRKAAEVSNIAPSAKLYEEGREFFQSLLSQEAILGFQE